VKLRAPSLKPSSPVSAPASTDAPTASAAVHPSTLSIPSHPLRLDVSGRLECSIRTVERHVRLRASLSMTLRQPRSAANIKAATRIRPTLPDRVVADGGNAFDGRSRDSDEALVASTPGLLDDVGELLDCGGRERGSARRQDDIEFLSRLETHASACSGGASRAARRNQMVVGVIGWEPSAKEGAVVTERARRTTG